MNDEKQEHKDSRMSAFTGIGSLIGVMIGGAHFGIMGAMVGGALGTVLVSSGIEVQIRDLKSKGKFHPFKGAVVVGYILAFILTAGTIALAPVIVNNLLTSDNMKPGFAGIIVTYAGPAFAGGIGALIPVWLSTGLPNVNEPEPTSIETVQKANVSELNTEPSATVAAPYKKLVPVTSVEVHCPNCRYQFRRPVSLVGHQEKCPECRFVFVIAHNAGPASQKGSEVNGATANEQPVLQRAAQSQARTTSARTGFVPRPQSPTPLPLQQTADAKRVAQSTTAQSNDTCQNGTIRSRISTSADDTRSVFTSVARRSTSKLPRGADQGQNVLDNLLGCLIAIPLILGAFVVVLFTTGRAINTTLLCVVGTILVSMVVAALRRHRGEL